MIIASFARFVVAATLAVTGATAAEVPTKFAPDFGCVARLPAPHPSGGRIKAHMRISCKRPVAAAHVEVQLWRLRARGWERIGTQAEQTKPSRVRTVDAATTAPANRDECYYYYRSTGKGHIIDWRGKQIGTPGEGVSFDQRYLKGLPPGCGTNW